IWKLDFPVTERVSSGISTKAMYKSMLSPLFIFMFICMLGTAVTELFTNQWVGVLLQNVTSNAILVLALVVTVQSVCRAFAELVFLSSIPSRLLLASAIDSTLGFYLLSTIRWNRIFQSVMFFRIGLTYFSSIERGLVSAYYPESDSVNINLLVGA